VAPLDAVAQVVVGFGQRAFGDAHVSGRFPMPVVPECLREIGRRRSSGIAELIAETEILAGWRPVN
jgi:hypothetical protein